MCQALCYQGIHSEPDQPDSPPPPDAYILMGKRDIHNRQGYVRQGYTLLGGKVKQEKGSAVG